MVGEREAIACPCERIKIKKTLQNKMPVHITGIETSNVACLTNTRSKHATQNLLNP